MIRATRAASAWRSCATRVLTDSQIGLVFVVRRSVFMAVMIILEHTARFCRVCSKSYGEGNVQLGKILDSRLHCGRSDARHNCFCRRVTRICGRRVIATTCSFASGKTRTTQEALRTGTTVARTTLGTSTGRVPRTKWTGRFRHSTTTSLRIRSLFFWTILRTTPLLKSLLVGGTI